MSSFMTAFCNVELAGRELCYRVSLLRAKMSSQLAAGYDVESV